MSDARGRKRVIGSVPPASPGRWDDVEALRAYLAWLGHNLSRQDLVEAAAASALFDVHYSERWYGDAAANACSGDLLGEMCEAVGCKHQWVIGQSFGEMWQTLAERVERGQPTIVGGMMPGDLPGTSRCGDYHLFVGYESANGDARAALCGHEGEGPVVWTHLPTALGRPHSWQARVRCLSVAPNVWAARPMLIVESTDKPSSIGTVELALTNLRRAVLAARQNEGPTGYWRLWSGLRALEQWAHDIENYPQEIELRPEHERGFPLTNITLTLSAQLEARRRQAARYLRNIRHLLPRDAKVAVCQASMHCDTTARLLVDFRELLFGTAPTHETEETGRRNLMNRPTRLSAAVLLRQVVSEEEAMVSSLEHVFSVMQ